MGTSPTIEAARELAERAHAKQMRKAGNVPYFTHLDAVAQLVAEHGHDDELTIAAAYLHDLIEDQPSFETELRARMPLEVIHTVELLSETKLDAQGNKRPKAERFAEYCAGLQRDSPATRRALAVSAADKIHNAQSLLESEARGDGLLMRLATRPGEHQQQFAVLRRIYRDKVSPSLFDA